MSKKIRTPTIEYYQLYILQVRPTHIERLANQSTTLKNYSSSSWTDQCIESIATGLPHTTQDISHKYIYFSVSDEACFATKFSSSPSLPPIPIKHTLISFHLDPNLFPFILCVLSQYPALSITLSIAHPPLLKCSQPVSIQIYSHMSTKNNSFPYSKMRKHFQLSSYASEYHPIPTAHIMLLLKSQVEAEVCL